MFDRNRNVKKRNFTGKKGAFFRYGLNKAGGSRVTFTMRFSGELLRHLKWNPNVDNVSAYVNEEGHLAIGLTPNGYSLTTSHNTKTNRGVVVISVDNEDSLLNVPLTVYENVEEFNQHLSYYEKHENEKCDHFIMVIEKPKQIALKLPSKEKTIQALAR